MEDLGSEAEGHGEEEGRESRVKAEERVVDAMGGTCCRGARGLGSGVSSSGGRKAGDKKMRRWGCAVAI